MSKYVPTGRPRGRPPKPRRVRLDDIKSPDDYGPLDANYREKMIAAGYEPALTTLSREDTVVDVTGKNNVANRELLKATIAGMRLRGKQITEICREIGIDRAFAYKLYKEIETQWMESARRSLDEFKAEELARIDTLEAEAWDAWNRSKKDAMERRQEWGYDQQGEMRRTAQKALSRNRDGDARFLAVVMECIDRRCKLLGLDSPQLLAVRNDNADTPIEDRLARYQSVLSGVSVGIALAIADGNRPGQSLDSGGPPREAGDVLDVDGRVRESTA